MLSNYQHQSTAPIEAVIFDLDDTLIDWSLRAQSWPEYIAPCMQATVDYIANNGHGTIETAAFADVHMDILRKEWAIAREEHGCVSLAGTLHMAFEQMGLAAAEIDVQAVMRAWPWQPMPGVQPYADTHAVLDTLRAQGIKTGLVTNAFQPMWMRDVELEAYDLIDRLDARITSGDTGFVKPNPAIYWRMLGLLDTSPDRAIFVGDSPKHDIAGANATGILSVLIDPPHLDRDMENAKPDYVINALSELLPIVEGLRS